MPLEQTARVNRGLSELHRRGAIPKQHSPIQAAIDRIAQKQAESGGEPFGKAQHIPKGWEAVEVLPKWINEDGQGRPNRYKVQAASLHHAIRIPGTNHILTSDVKLTKAQLESLADDYKGSIGRIGHKFPNGVAMHVPGGRTGNARGWVRDVPGVRTFYMKASLARDADESRYQLLMDVNDKLIGKGTYHMPAVKKSGRQYTMLHEMGHLIDAQHDHTHSFGRAVTSGPELDFWKSKQYEPSERVAARLATTSSQQLFAAAMDEPKADAPSLSRYGRTNISEGYAEAAAQYFLGGKGSNPVADAYAHRYGW